jgi:AcrR family transcriptional regulator
MIKEKILEAAAKEFANKGFDSVSMNELSKKVDINKATIYHHFKDRKTLYQEVVKKEINKLHQNLKKESNFEDKSGEELLINYIKNLTAIIKERPHIVSLILKELANYGTNIDKSLVPHIENELEYLREIINKLNLKRKYKDIDIYVIFSLIHGTIETFYSIQMSSLPIGNDLKLKQNSDSSLDYISEYITDMLLVALT